MSRYAIINDRIVDIVKKCENGELKPMEANIKLFDDLFLLIY